MDERIQSVSPISENPRLAPRVSSVVAREAMNDARGRLLSTKRPTSPSGLLDAVCDVWARYRGAGRDSDRSESTGTHSNIYVAFWERSHWLVDASVLMGLHSDFDPTRSTAEVCTLFALWSEYSLARKSQSAVLRLLVQTLDKALHEAVTARSPSGSATVLDPELSFEPAVPQFPLLSHTWVPTSPDCFDELNTLDIAEPWRVWWLTRLGEYPLNLVYNIDLRTRQ